MVAIYQLHQYDGREAFPLLLPSLNRPCNVRSKNDPRGAVGNHCVNHMNIKTRLASHYYIKYSLALWKMVSNNCCVQTGVLFFF